MIVVPDGFSSSIMQRFGEQGRQWVMAIPAGIREICTHWELEVEGTPRYGYWGFVCDVRGSMIPAVLKLTWPYNKNAPLERVIDVLTLWDGQGAVRLLRSNLEHHALLLERLDPTATLENLNIEEALTTAGQLLRRLALPAPVGWPALTAVAQHMRETLVVRWELLARPIPDHIIHQALVFTHALTPAIGAFLVNWDLHYGNVLGSIREPWLVIDPQVLSGDLEYGIAQLLWWRLEDIEAAGGVPWALDILVKSAKLDFKKTRRWLYVRTVDYWLSGLENGLTIDPPRCERVVRSLGHID